MHLAGADLEVDSLEDLAALDSGLLERAQVEKLRERRPLPEFVEMVSGTGRFPPSALYRAVAEARAKARGLANIDFVTGDLLTAREASAWVSYKLDGGIDHVLVDEAQDTSPGQWRVVDALVRDRARLVDGVLGEAWRRHVGPLSDELALVAVGGYGRGELHPCSDIDIMILLGEKLGLTDFFGVAIITAGILAVQLARQAD